MIKLKFRKATYKELHRLLFAYIFIAIVLLATLYSQLKTTQEHFDAIVYDGVINNITQAIEPNNPRIVNISEDIERKCLDFCANIKICEQINSETVCTISRKQICYFDDECIIRNLYQIPITPINVTNNTRTMNVDEILTNGSNCKGISTVYASVLKNLGIDTYLVLQNGHICTMFKDGTKTHLVYCLGNETIKFIKKV